MGIGFWGQRREQRGLFAPFSFSFAPAPFSALGCCQAGFASPGSYYGMGASYWQTDRGTA